jgi:hypothetical protein
MSRSRTTLEGAKLPAGGLLVVRMPSVGGAENAANFAYPNLYDFERAQRRAMKRSLNTDFTGLP